MPALALLLALALATPTLAASDTPPVWRVLAATATTLRLEVTIPSVQMEAAVGPETAGAVALTIPGAAETGRTGTPALPVISRLVAVPAGARVSGAIVDFESSVREDLDLVPVSDAAGVSVRRDERSYASAGWQGARFAAAARLLACVPELEASLAAGDQGAAKSPVGARPVVAVGEAAVMAGQDVVPLSIAPVLYDAVNRRAAICNRIVIELTFAGDGAKATAPRRPLPRSFATLLADEGALNLPAAKSLPVAGEEPGLWVAVARNNATLLAKLQPLLDWRRRQGYQVEVLDADAAGNTTAGIKAALKAIYDDPNRPPLEFVTIIGDVSGSYGVPTWHEGLSGYGGEGDHYYAMLDGTDILADVHIGRLSFSQSSLSQFDIIVNKIVNYEKNPPMDNTAWYGRASLMGDPSDSGITTIWVNQWLKTRLQEMGWAQIDTTWSGNFPGQLLSTLNPGASVFAYRGFWGMSGINSGHIGALTNGGRLPVALLPTCGTGSFADEDNALCEAWLRAGSGGGVGAVGTATTGTHTRYNNAFFLNMWSGLLEGGDARLGAGQSAGKLGLYTNYYLGEPDRAEIWAVWNSLMGDPATDMWQGVPQALTVTAPGSLAVGANALTATVTIGAAPATGARVCALDAGGARWFGQVDAAGHVTLAGSPAVAGAMQLVVSGHGLLPYVGTVTVGATGTWCGATGVAVIDNGTLGSNGNGDGQVNPGETLALVPTLTNTGTIAATGVGATVTGGAPWLTVTSGSCTFGTIAAGQSVAATGAPVLVTVAADAPDGQHVHLDVDAGSGGQHWLSALTLTVSSPRLTVAEVLFGGLGGTCDPGESGALSLTLANTGSLAAPALTATLTTTSPWLTVTDPDGTFAAVAAGGSVANLAHRFAVHASSDCFAGHLAPLTLTLRDGPATVAVLTCVLPVGAVATDAPAGPDNHGYYAFDDTDVTSGFAPVYDWVELAPDLGGPGADVGLGDFGWEEDDTKTVDLPFTFRYYGKEQAQLSICSNGWVAFGQCSLISYHNTGLPGAGGTPRALVAPFWDNLQQWDANRVYHWYDSTQHRYVIQWRGLVQCYSGYTGDQQDFELILLDPAWHSEPDEDGMILFQYQTVNDTDGLNAYATVGIQSPDGDDGLLYQYWNQSLGGGAPLASGRAILFRTLGDLPVPQAQVTPGTIVASAAPGAQLTRVLQVANAGDAGTTLEVAVTKFDPATFFGDKAAVAGKTNGVDGPVVTPSGIAGTTVTADVIDYLPGETVDLHLTIDTVTTGQEWIIGVVVDAPQGAIVNSSTGISGGSGTITSNGATGNGARLEWGGSGHLDDNQTGSATINLTFGNGATGPLTFAWELQGDEWGDDPHYLSGEFTVLPRGPVIDILEPLAGSVVNLGSPLDVTFVAFNGPTTVAIELQRDEGQPWQTLAAAVPAATGSWTWPAVTGAPGPYARVRVFDVANPAVGDTSGVFAIGRDLNWLQVDTSSLSVGAGSSTPLTVTLDATGLEVGVYEALLVLAGNGVPVTVPVTFTVTNASAVDDVPPPATLTLLGAVPNPFNPRTVIRFALPAEQDARLDVYSLDGRLVRRLLAGRLAAGAHDVLWDGRDEAGHDAASGIYFHRLSSGGEVRTGKMVLTR